VVLKTCADLLNLLSGGCSEICRSGYYPAFNFLTLLGR
jgi:hypothetical protein